MKPVLLIRWDSRSCYTQVGTDSPRPLSGCGWSACPWSRRVYCWCRCSHGPGSLHLFQAGMRLWGLGCHTRSLSPARTEPDVTSDYNTCPGSHTPHLSLWKVSQGERKQLHVPHILQNATGVSRFLSAAEKYLKSRPSHTLKTLRNLLPRNRAAEPADILSSG